LNCITREEKIVFVVVLILVLILACLEYVGIVKRFGKHRKKLFFFKERKIGKLVGINYFTRETFVLDLVDANRMLLASEKSLKISKLNCSFLVVCLDPVI
jgi:hypothetical protein